MVSRKYAGDYRLENRADARTGKVKTVPVYAGKWYAFDADAATVRRMKRLYPALSALCAVMLLLVLTLNAPCGHVFYVMLPLVALVFPTFFAVAAAWRLLTAKEKVTREHRDRIQQRYASSLLFIILFSAISASGHVLYWFRGNGGALDVVSFAATALILAASIAMFVRKDALRMSAVADGSV